VKDTSAGFRAYRAETLEAIDYASTRAKGYGFQLETAYRAAHHGAKIVELPITFTDRVRGYSKMSGAVIVEEMAMMTWWGIRDRVRRRTA
jgi:dolichol-phosphate mannosyltransferase